MSLITAGQASASTQICIRGLALGPAAELATLDEALKIAGAADQAPFDDHHRQRRPAGPHLEREPPAPAAEVAAVLEILVREPGVVEELARLLWKRVLPHADHHDLIPRHRVLHLFQDVGTVSGDLRTRGRVDLRFVQDTAGHRAFLWFDWRRCPVTLIQALVDPHHQLILTTA